MPCSSHPPPDAPDSQRIEPAWLTETVLALARGVATDLAFDRLPILADALEEAGCDNFTLLTHLRTGETHWEDCWAFRLVSRPVLVLAGGAPITFAFCPPGTFMMGNYNREQGDQECPTHRVTLTCGFYAGIHPVTQQQWRAVAGNNPSSFKGDQHPVENVNWEEATRFCRRAGEVMRRPLRLPTEAEWEYACRAGSITNYHYGNVRDPERMNCDELVPFPGDRRVRGRPTPVGMFWPNDWGLHDCHGNVWEWCQDWYHPEFYRRGSRVDPLCDDGPLRQRVCRGGSWKVPATQCRSASRHALRPNERAADVGFRVVFTAT